jgi:hypothetical protein
LSDSAVAALLFCSVIGPARFIMKSLSPATFE